MKEILFCQTACYTLILNAVICAIFRWCHMCKPYNLNPSYFYPSRMFVTLAFLSISLLAPYLFHPESHDTWIFAKSFMLFYLPVFGTVSFRSFFFGTTRLWIRHYLLLLILPIAAFVELFVLACLGGDSLKSYGMWSEITICLLYTSDAADE